MSDNSSLQAAVEFVKSCCSFVDGEILVNTLYIQDRGRWRIWKTHIVAHGSEGGDEFNKKVDLDMADVLCLTEFGEVGYYSDYGLEDGKIQVSKLTKTRGKNANKANATSALTQAILDVSSKYTSKVEEGYGPTKEARREVKGIEDLSGVDSSGIPDWRVVPMAYHTFQKYEKKINYPCLVQPKLDGIMFVVVYHPSITSPYEQIEPRLKHVDGFTRGRETTPSQVPLMLEILPLLKAHPGSYVVGELYNKGMLLQNISSIVRDEKSREFVNYYMFDTFRVGNKAGFERRSAWLAKNVGEYLPETTSEKSPDDKEQKRCVLVDTVKVEDKASLERAHEKNIDDGFEGSMVRNLDSIYEYGLFGKEHRVNHAVKYKNRMDDEFPVVGFKQGKGGNEGLIIWICQTESGKKFSVNQEGPQDLRRRLFAKLSSSNSFDSVRGKLLTVNYMTLSDDGVPTQPIGKAFRDFDVYKHLGIDL